MEILIFEKGQVHVNLDYDWSCIFHDLRNEYSHRIQGEGMEFQLLKKLQMVNEAEVLEEVEN